MKTLLSGIQATGTLHLGNYLGAIKNWLSFQKEYKSYFFIADLHSITVPINPKDLHDTVLSNAAMYIACGLDFNKGAIFRQSKIPEHTELAWILGCFTQMGWMNRMTQFKDKAKNKDAGSLGLFAYPVLMAADILLYKPDIVPVGEDQKQHLELARDIAQSFNRNMKTEYFKLPEPVITGPATRVMSLKDGNKKMSKSDESDLSRINLTDSKDTIVKKFKKAKSDSITEIYYDKEKRPEVSNLLNIYSAISGKGVKDIVLDYKGKGFSDFKTDIAELVSDLLGPVNEKYADLINDKAQLIKILELGEEKAREVSSATLSEVKKIVGFTI
ncbi:MAG: tryptophan--tRNA ligase [Rickettsiales bacterium]